MRNTSAEILRVGDWQSCQSFHTPQLCIVCDVTIRKEASGMTIMGYEGLTRVHW